MIGQFSWVAIGRIVAALIQMATLAITAVWLGPTDFGILSAVLAVAIIPQALLDLGIPTFVLQVRASGKDPQLLRYALTVNGSTSLLLMLVSALALTGLGMFVSPIFFAMLPLAVWIGAERNVEVWLGIALADGDARLNVTFLVGRRIAALALMLGAYFLGSGPIFAYSISLAFTSAVASIWARRLLTARVEVPVREKRRLKELLAVTGPYWIHSTATQVRNIDTALVALIANPAQAGYYAVASRLTGPMRILPTSLAAVVLPRVARENGRVGRKLTLLIVFTLFAMSLLYAALAVVAPWAVETFLGQPYLPSVVPVQIVCAGLILGAVASLIAAVLQGMGQSRIVAVASVVASITCVVAIALGTIWWEAAGAAVGLVSSFAVQVLLMGGALIWLQARGSTTGRSPG